MNIEWHAIFKFLKCLLEKGNDSANEYNNILEQGNENVE